ncbi:MAG TPA: iron-sulfur cluster assembly protein [Trebonia sp.]
MTVITWGSDPAGPVPDGTGTAGPPALGGESLVSAALAALTSVRDPELDEPITALGFVASCVVSRDGRAAVRLRLPTYFCAPNFAFLMVADAYDAVTGVPGVHSAEVILEDHFASDAINAGVAAQAGFVQSFDGEAVAELGDLRAQFLRKAVMAGTDLVCRPLVADGATPAELLALTLGAVPASPERERLRQRRADLGLSADDDAPLLIDPATGERVAEAAIPLHLRKARVTRAGIEANTSICSGMFRVRYPDGWTP